MKLPASLESQGISQDMVTTLREIAAFRRNEYPRPSSARPESAPATDAKTPEKAPEKNRER